MKQATHARKGKNISNLGTGETETFKSINASKRGSRQLRLGGNVVRRLPRSDSERMKTFSNGRQ